MNQAFWTQVKYFFPRSVKFHEPLKNHTSFGIGGPADCLVTVRTMEELERLIILANDYQQPIFVLGGGTNMLIRDGGIRGLVISLSGEFRGAEVRGRDMIGGAACPIPKVMRLAVHHSLAGLEFLAGLPGLLGGAVRMNAGSGDQGIGSLVKEIHLVYPDGSVGVRSSGALSFSYRKLPLGLGEIITRAVLQLHQDEGKEAVWSRIKERFTYRADHQPLREKSAGCIFKNPPGDSAGRLIDRAGLKGLSVGDAQVSILHANFIINRHQASCAEVLYLMDLVQKKVYQFCGIVLEPEVLVAGE
jgi:UDP-N-acetylmuramate dehydrogenase